MRRQRDVEIMDSDRFTTNTAHRLAPDVFACPLVALLDVVAACADIARAADEHRGAVTALAKGVAGAAHERAPFP